MIATPAHALSCMPYGIPQALQEIVAAEEGYVAAIGTLTFDESKLPKVDMERQSETPPVTQIGARLKGKSLTKSGFTHPLNISVVFEVACYGPWCASAPSGEQVLAFLKKTKTGYVLSTNPCGGHVFFNPNTQALDSVQLCYTKGHCPKPVDR